MRIGHGYDVHRFEHGRRLVLGGVLIPSEEGLLGHSDADVLAHAVMDAILGAAALPDIGAHFPPSDSQYKDADSMELLRAVWREAAALGFTPGNLDCTLVAERPRLAPYIEAMRQSLAAALECDISAVNVKATTEEGLGLAGAGIGAHAVILLNKNDL